MAERIMKRYKLENYYSLNYIKEKINELNTKSILDNRFIETEESIYMII